MTALDLLVLGDLAGMKLAAPEQPGGMMGEGTCPGMMAMGGGAMWITMALFAILLVAVIAALVALTIYLLRRSQPPRSPAM